MRKKNMEIQKHRKLNPQKKQNKQAHKARPPPHPVHLGALAD